MEALMQFWGLEQRSTTEGVESKKEREGGRQREETGEVRRERERVSRSDQTDACTEGRACEGDDGHL